MKQLLLAAGLLLAIAATTIPDYAHSVQLEEVSNKLNHKIVIMVVTETVYLNSVYCPLPQVVCIDSILDSQCAYCYTVDKDGMVSSVVIRKDE